MSEITTNLTEVKKSHTLKRHWQNPAPRLIPRNTLQNAQAR